MGVRGLTTFINTNEDEFLQRFYLHDCNVVIDGNSLCAQLYQKLPVNAAYGGEYDKYAHYVKRFFLGLRKCKVSAYVIFDGGLERKKLRTAFSRLRSKLFGVSQLYPGNQLSYKIFPLFLCATFMEVLVEMQIPHTVTEFEADDDIAALARYLNCPVLSYDSDFFIYNVLYIPFNMVNMKPVIIDNKSEKCNAIECKLYTVDNFVNHFEGLKKELLPLVAVLLGNDYIQKKVFSNFFAHLKIPKSRKHNEQQRSIKAVLEWLRSETIDTAVTKIIGRLKLSNKTRVLHFIAKSCEDYNKSNCPSLEYFNLKPIRENNYTFFNVPQETFNNELIETNEEDTEESDNSSEESCMLHDVDKEADEEPNTHLPQPIVKGIRQGFIPNSYINLFHGFYFFSPQPEDCNDKDCFTMCIPILRYCFDILTDFSKKSLTYVGREGIHLKKIDVPSLLSEDPFKSEAVPLGDTEQMNKYFVHFISETLHGINLELIQTVPSNFQITLISILWWIKYHDVTLAQVYAVILTYITLDVIDERTGTPRSHFFFNNKNKKRIEEIKKNQKTEVEYDKDNIFLNKNKVTYEDCLVAASVLIELFEMDSDVKKRPKGFKIEQIHRFAQFQCCLQQINYLNTLCSSKYDKTIYHKTYNGVLSYNLLNKLEDHSDPMSCVQQYLKGADTVLLLFKNLVLILNKCAQDIGATLRTNCNRKRRGRRRTRKNIDFLCEEFLSEVYI